MAARSGAAARTFKIHEQGINELSDDLGAWKVDELSYTTQRTHNATIPVY